MLFPVVFPALCQLNTLMTDYLDIVTEMLTSMR